MNFKQPIVLVGPAYPLRGGIAHFNESFAQSLMDVGYSIDIVSFYLQYPSILFPGKTQKSVDDDPPERLMINEWLSSVNPLSWRSAARKVIGLKPQLVVIRFWIPFMGPALGALAKRLRAKGIRVVGLVDNAIPHEARGFDKSLSNLFFKHCNAFFTLSESVAEDLKVLAPGIPIGTSPHPVYDIFGQGVSKAEAREKLNLDPKKKYILFFGFVRAYKGLDLLIEALGVEAVKELDLHLIVAGEFYEDQKKYLDLIDRLGLTDSITIRSDYIPQEDVKYYFCASNLVAQTYRSATQSGVTQIAYQFDRPMLVTNVGGLPEIVPDDECGFVVDPNPDAIAHAIVRFFKENKEKVFSENVARKKHELSWKYFTEKFLEFAGNLR